MEFTTVVGVVVVDVVVVILAVAATIVINIINQNMTFISRRRKF
jgi:hypothetical protein